MPICLLLLLLLLLFTKKKLKFFARCGWNFLFLTKKGGGKGDLGIGVCVGGGQTEEEGLPDFEKFEGGECVGGG